MALEGYLSRVSGLGRKRELIPSRAKDKKGGKPAAAAAPLVYGTFGGHLNEKYCGHFQTRFWDHERVMRPFYRPIRIEDIVCM